MNILQSILFISFLFTTTAQWYIKKTSQTKPMNYPNPGKRSLLEEERTYIAADCSKSFSHLHSYQEKVDWIFTCVDAESSSNINENPSFSDSNDLSIESSPTSRLILHGNRSPYAALSSSTRHDNLYNKFLMKLLQSDLKNK